MRDRIVKAADRLFYVRGIQAVSVDLIAAEIGISKRTLYNHFASKAELVLAYLARRSRPTATTDLPPAAQILAEFDRLETCLAEATFRGCPFVNAVAEAAEPADAVAEVAADFKEQRRLWFRTLLCRLAVAESDELATQLMLLVDGAVTAVLTRGDARAGRAARNAATVLLAAARSDVPGAAQRRQ